MCLARYHMLFRTVSRVGNNAIEGWGFNRSEQRAQVDFSLSQAYSSDLAQKRRSHVRLVGR